jgi:hypothetical protein
MYDDIISRIITIIIGILIGAVIGYFLFKDIKYIGPNSNQIVKEIYMDDDGKKFKFKPKVCICPSAYSMKKLHNKGFKNEHPAKTN